MIALVAIFINLPRTTLGLDWLPDDTVLTDDEVVRLVRVGVELLGIREVRFTGGEPLVRRGLVDIVRRTAGLDPRPETSLTTNALGLSRTAQALADAGLDRVNVSLDTIRREDFLTITRRDRLADVDPLAPEEDRAARGLYRPGGELPSLHGLSRLQGSGAPAFAAARRRATRSARLAVVPDDHHRFVPANGGNSFASCASTQRHRR